ncbi:hypothetical protein Pan44_15710 [Caulifigura coniformis]|uniref:Uncharacterized protein n=1 Tax=Caulifigura coniformis TaxID=2527983 RepID=A0A517SBP6_9PLAN|nr:hypothetical protein [Caulifigura coniformis]QDT53549.1 hypothetical protein Pan44_15710 [Caulifigura coniformis]
MGWFSRKDWNVLAVIFERSDLYTVAGQRAKGGDADKARDGAKLHKRAVFWAVFDQKRSFVEGGPGQGAINVPPEVVKKLERELPMNRTVQDVLKALEAGTENKCAKSLQWMGYPKKAVQKDEEDFS